MANVEKVTELSNVGQDLKHDFPKVTKTRQGLQVAI